MKNLLLPLLLIAGLMFIQVNPILAQDGSSRPSQQEKEEKKVQFNGLGRTILQQTELGGPTLETGDQVERVTDGEFILDLAINATPNSNTEVQAILRLRNELGGFFGSGQSIEVRELWARGIIGDIVGYHVGDMDMVMTPFTLFNPDEEGMINYPAIFQPQKDVIYYEQFYMDGNTRRLQGAKLDFGLNFSKLLESANVNGFVSRIRAADFFSTPTRFVGGGSIDLLSQSLNDSLGMKAEIGLNLAHTWDDLSLGQANTGIRNSVATIDFDLTVVDKDNFAIHVLGEAGRSNLKVMEAEETLDEEDDTFLEAGASLHLKSSNLTLSATFVDIGPDFFSIGAQSKRIDFTRNKSFFNRLGRDDLFRAPGLFDISRDRAIYTFQLSDRLMAYDPRLSNTNPYGRATPNRQGLRFGLDWVSDNEGIDVNIDAALMEELRGQGTNQLKSFTLIRPSANINFHKISGWKKKLRLTLGAQFENTSRDGVEVEQVELNSNLIEVGLEAELFPKFEFLLGGTFLAADGRDYLPVIEEFNNVRDFSEPFVVDDTETLIGAGFKYNFKENIYLTLQYQQFDFSRATDPTNDYDLNQIFVLYNMNF